MKKIVFAFLAALLVIGLNSCTQDPSSGEDKTAATNVTDNTTNPPTAPATTPNAGTPEAKKPSYQEKAEAMEKSSIEWNETEFDFGKVKDGEIVRHTFSFTNTGSHPVVLQRAKASCGCTTPNWSKEPVAPGEKGVVDVEFNSKNKPGMQTKTITVTGNFAEGINKVLKIRGEVQAAATQ